MKRKVPLSTQLYQALFPFRAEGVDPSSFSEHVRKNLLPELRTEVRMFYGDDLSDTLEARFPGLDYTNRIHRFRLSRFPHHRKLFLTFDKLGWTLQEIYQFCDWEGTILIKKRYETQHGVIRDTTADFIHQEDIFHSALAGYSYVRQSGEALTASRASTHSANDQEDDYEQDGNESNTSRIPAETQQAASAQQFNPTPQSALDLARQALRSSQTSRPSASWVPPSLRQPIWPQENNSPGPRAASRSSRVASARAAC